MITIEKLEALKKGSSKVFNEIFNTYWEKLYAAAYSRVQDYGQAQDIVQEIFIYLWDRREELNLNPDSLEFYLLKSVKHRVINYYRSSKVKERVLEQALHHFDDVQHDHLLAIPYGEVEEFVKTQIEELPKTMKAIYKLRDDNFSIRDIAASLNVAEQTVKNNLTEAQQRLRKAVKWKFKEEQMTALFLSIIFLTKG